MRVFASALWLTVATAFLAGCAATWSYPGESGAPSAVTTPEADGTPLPEPPRGAVTPGWLSPQLRAGKSGPLLYVAEQDAGKVLIYPEKSYNHSPIGTITSGVSGPYGLYVDASGNLYVANQRPPTVTVYAPGSTSASATYSKDLTRPLYPIVDQYGDLFVSNAGRGCSGGTVVEYKSGSQYPYQTLMLPGPEVDGMDFDTHGNLYVAYRVCGRHRVGSIEMFAPGSTQGERVRIRANQPQGLIVDDRGNILLVETGKWGTVDFIRAGKRYPEFRLKLPGGDPPVELAITADRSRLYVASFAGAVFVTKYPITPKSSWTTVDEMNGTPQGIALSNGQTF